MSRASCPTPWACDDGHFAPLQPVARKSRLAKLFGSIFSRNTINRRRFVVQNLDELSAHMLRDIGLASDQTWLSLSQAAQSTTPETSLSCSVCARMSTSP
jgi:uncharacterized protein YjiS (DUF1127 family)